MLSHHDRCYIFRISRCVVCLHLRKQRKCISRGDVSFLACKYNCLPCVLLFLISSKVFIFTASVWWKLTPQAEELVWHSEKSSSSSSHPCCTGGHALAREVNPQLQWREEQIKNVKGADLCLWSGTDCMCINIDFSKKSEVESLTVHFAFGEERVTKTRHTCYLYVYQHTYECYKWAYIFVCACVKICAIKASTVPDSWPQRLLIRKLHIKWNKASGKLSLERF